MAEVLSDDALLYGHDPSERIVALHTVGPATMRLYRRRSPSEVVTEDVRVHPFFFLSDIDLLAGFPRERFQFQELSGSGFFRYVVAFSGPLGLLRRAPPRRARDRDREGAA